MDTGQRPPEGTVRSVACATHGLRYDPQTHTGCVRCRAEAGGSGTDGGAGPAARRASGGPPLALWLVGVLALVVLGLVLFGGEDESQSAAASSGAEERAASATAGPPRTGSERAPTRRAGAEDRGREPVALEGADAGWPTLEAYGSITVVDGPEDEPFRVDELLAPDLESVRFQAVGDVLTITFEFTQPLETHARDFAAGIAPATVFVDTDLDPTTGEKGFAGREGFERAITAYLGVKYDPEADSYLWAGGMAETPIAAFACSYDVGTVSGHFVDMTFDPSDEAALAATTCFGSTFEISVPYEQLGVMVGQTVRLATEEELGSGQLPQYFLADVLLTLE